jgi:hypothetical protein
MDGSSCTKADEFATSNNETEAAPDAGTIFVEKGTVRPVKMPLLVVGTVKFL